MEEKVNYITHLNGAFETIVNDNRLSPFHISLYFTLFQYWNISKFRNPISINREEMMRASKIGSANTYTKCLKELHHYKYINYMPSHSPLVGSKIHLYTFNKTNCKTSNKTSDNALDISADKSTHKTTEKVVRPSINSLNKTNKLKHKKEHEPNRTKNNRKSSYSSSGRIEEKEKLRQKKKVSLSIREGRKGEAKPSIKQVKTHFASKQWPSIEAEKFFNYFQSNGWLVGGKTPMKNWQASAANWILNTAKFSPSNGTGRGEAGKVKPGKLQTSSDKDYAEPL